MSSTWGKQLKYGEFEIAGAREGKPRLLGEGSFGKTYEAVRIEAIGGTTIKQFVAVKVLNPELLTSKSKRFQFIQELLALTKFQHSNLIHYIRCGEENGEVYYAMELCRGGDLMQLVRRYGPLSEKVVALIGLQVATGLREVHQRHRLVHRDIKPSNIMLVDEFGPDIEARHLAFRFEQQDSLCRVVDFGLVNFALEAGEAPQRFVGSPMYSSPEQICERPVDGRSDIYSLGMTLWYLLQGKGPLLDAHGEEVKELGEAMRRHTSPESHESELPERLSPEFRKILARLVEKRAEKRISSAGELQNILRDFLSRAPEDDLAAETFSITRLNEPIDTVYELGEKMPSRWARASYAARERKGGGREVKLSVVANVLPGAADSPEIADATNRLGKLAALSRQPHVPEALVPLRDVILTADLLAFTEEMFPHIALSDVLKARAAVKRPMGFSEAVIVLRPLAEALDFLLQHGQDTVLLPCEEVWLSGPGVAEIAVDPQALARPLGDWAGLEVRFSMMCVPPKKESDGAAGESGSGETMSASMQMSEGSMHPEPVFARLVYRVLNGSEVAAAVQFTPHAYVPAVTLGHASNNLLRDIICGQRPPAGVASVLKDLCANEGVVLRAQSSPPLARVIGPGIVHSPYAASGSTQQIAEDSWQPGAEFICLETGKKVLLPHQLPDFRGGVSQSSTPTIASNPVAKSAPPVSPAPISQVTGTPPLARSSGSASVIRSVARTVPPALPKAPAPSPTGSSIGTTPPPPAQSAPSPTHSAAPSPLATLLEQKKLLYAAGGAGAFLLLLAVFFLGRSMNQKTVSPTPPPTASSTPVPTPAPPISGPTPEPKAAGFEGRKPGDYKMIAGVAFRWCPPTGSNGFTMGSPLYEAGRNVDETQHQVVLSKGFWLAETELTQGQWQQITGTTVRQQAERGLADETEYPFTPTTRMRIRDYMGLKVNDADKAIGVEESGMPMYWTPWPEAVEYCRRLTERERAAGRIPQGWEICLPTEAQWEYACRAGTTVATYAGDLIILGENNAPVLDDIAWYGGNSGVGYSGHGWDASSWVGRAYQFTTAGPRAVGQKQANAWGLRDMLGNVVEWCADYYGPYPDSDVRDPQGPPAGLVRVIRGGGWLLAPKACRAAARASNAPGVSGRVVGFRLSVAPIKPPIEPAAETTAVPRSLPREVLAAFSGASAGQRKIVGGVAFHWCPAPGPQGFVMGSPQTEMGRQFDEAQHQAILSTGFWIAETEITQAQWRQIMGTNVREQASLALNDETTYGNPPKTFRQFYNLKPNDLDKLVFGEEPNLPMYYVNWSDGVTYCQRATQQARSQGQLPASWEIRLPTEAQWEYAARAGTDTATFGGDLKILGKNNAPALDQIAWYGGNSGVGYRGKGLPAGAYPEKQYTFTVAGPRAVGKKAANPWGLMDSIGNLGEWCADWYGPYPPGPVVDPEGPPAGGFRVLRGGGFDTMAFLCRSAARVSYAPTLRNWDFGFRPVIVPGGR